MPAKTVLMTAMIPLPPSETTSMPLPVFKTTANKLAEHFAYGSGVLGAGLNHIQDMSHAVGIIPKGNNDLFSLKRFAINHQRYHVAVSQRTLLQMLVGFCRLLYHQGTNPRLAQSKGISGGFYNRVVVACAYTKGYGTENFRRYTPYIMEIAIAG